MSVFCASSSKEVTDDEISLKAEIEANKWKESKGMTQPQEAVFSDTVVVDTAVIEPQKVEQLAEAAVAVENEAQKKMLYIEKNYKTDDNADYKKTFRLFSSPEYNYSLIVPTMWTISQVKIKDIHYARIMFDKNSIKVKSYQLNNSSFEKEIEKAKNRYLTIDPFVKLIVADKVISLDKGLKGRLFVIEYKPKYDKNRFILRVMAVKNNDTVHFIYCESPQNQFYFYERIYNTAMVSFSVK